MHLRTQSSAKDLDQQVDQRLRQHQRQVRKERQRGGRARGQPFQELVT